MQYMIQRRYSSSTRWIGYEEVDKEKADIHYSAERIAMDRAEELNQSLKRGEFRAVKLEVLQ